VYTKAEQQVTALLSWLILPTIDMSSQSDVLRSWMLPIAAAVLVGGVTWQAILMVLTRRGLPLVQAIKGLWTAAVWGAVATTATAATIHATDLYSCWVLRGGLRGGGTTNLPDNCGPDLINAINDSPAVDQLDIFHIFAGLVTGGMAPAVLDPMITILLVIHIALLVFRTGALAVLVGVSQIAAAGAATRGTSLWIRRVLSWMLALVFYKPVAATVYAVGFMFLGTARTVGEHAVAAGMLLLALVALPALMKFFNWSVGALESGAGSGLLGLAGTVAVAEAIHKFPRSDSSGGGGSASTHAVFLQRTLAVQTPQATVAGQETVATVSTAGAAKAATGAAAGGSAAGASAAGASAAGASAAGVSAVVPYVAPVILAAAGATQLGIAAKNKVVDHLEPDKE